MSGQQYSKIEELEYIIQQINNAEYQNAMESIKSVEENITSEQVKSYLGILKARISRLRGNYQEAITQLKDIKSSLNTETDQFVVLNLYLELIWNNRFLGNVKMAKSDLGISQKILAEFKIDNVSSVFPETLVEITKVFLSTVLGKLYPFTIET
ncbi:MAG: hypothetical protein IH840_09605 [Candidatus Heimdallarchaeota archaeon]|nr:hypothetical protein [Candidatus Heimdallarchaeota archaeon]